jgi:hypothetical protein
MCPAWCGVAVMRPVGAMTVWPGVAPVYEGSCGAETVYLSLCGVKAGCPAPLSAETVCLVLPGVAPVFKASCSARTKCLASCGVAAGCPAPLNAETLCSKLSSLKARSFLMSEDADIVPDVSTLRGRPYRCLEKLCDLYKMCGLARMRVQGRAEFDDARCRGRQGGLFSCWL